MVFKKYDFIKMSTINILHIYIYDGNLEVENEDVF